MLDSKQSGALQLEVMHICEKCSAEYKYAQVPEDVTVTGIIECAKCGYAGPLHVIIQARDEQNFK